LKEHFAQHQLDGAPAEVLEPYKETDEENLWASLVVKHDGVLDEEDNSYIRALWTAYKEVQ